MSDEVAVLRHGRIAERGSLVELFGNPEDAYTRTRKRTFRGTPVE